MSKTEEGKLQQRINAIIEEIDDLDISSEHAKLRIASDIETAKKEFPWFPKKEDVEGKSDIQVYMVYKRDVHAWAKRWLGT